MEKKILVYLNKSENNDEFVGTLYIEQIRGTESCSFEYAESYIENNTISIDPELELYIGRQYHSCNRLFGIFQNSSPDR